MKYFSISDEDLVKPGDKAIKDELRKLMWDSAGIIRSRRKLEMTLVKIECFLDREIGKFLRYRLKTSKNIVESTIYRKESIGACYIVD